MATQSHLEVLKQNSKASSPLLGYQPHVCGGGKMRNKRKPYKNLKQYIQNTRYASRGNPDLQPCKSGLPRLANVSNEICLSPNWIATYRSSECSVGWLHPSNPRLRKLWIASGPFLASSDCLRTELGKISLHVYSSYFPSFLWLGWVVL